jgi:hypothetical protein
MRNLIILIIVVLASIPILGLIRKLLRHETATNRELAAGFASVVVAFILVIYVMIG